MNTNEELKQRVLKGIEYFWKLKPSELDYVKKAHWTTFLKLLKIYINGETIHMKVLDEKPREMRDAEEIFEIKAI